MYMHALDPRAEEASEAYDVLADDGSSHRGLFLIDKAARRGIQ